MLSFRAVAPLAVASLAVTALPAAAALASSPPARVPVESRSIDQLYRAAVAADQRPDFDAAVDDRRHLRQRKGVATYDKREAAIRQRRATSRRGTSRA